MTHCPHCTAHLASSLDKRETRRSFHRGPDCNSMADVDELIELARQLRELPPLQPDQAWLRASKRALLSRFEELSRPPQDLHGEPA